MNKRKWMCFACLALSVWSGLELLGAIAAWLIADVFGGISFHVTHGATIGIIGGADGPTSILIAAAPVSGWAMLLWLALLIAGICGCRHFQSSKQNM